MATLSVVATRIPREMITAVIRFYQFVASPFPSRCRYTPSCSTYALDAVRRHGAFKGSWLAVRRIGRCHPFGGSGYDPVP